MALAGESNNRRALLLGLSAVLLWSTAATAFKLALAELTVLQLLTVAVLASTVVLLIALAWRGQLSALLTALRQRPLYFIAMGALNPLAYYCILLAAYDRLPAQQAQVINYTWAITLALLSIPILGQRLARRDWLAVLMGYGGVLIIATEGAPFSMQFTDGLGVLLALASTLLWAVFWLLSARAEGDATLNLTGYFLCATPLALLLCQWQGGGFPEIGRGFAAAVYVGLFEMGVTWMLWAGALRLASNASRVGNLIFLSPIISLVLISQILGEAIHPATVIGLALIVPGIIFQQRGASS